MTSLTPLRKKITQKITLSPGFISKTVTETTRFNEGTLKRSLQISQTWSPKIEKQHHAPVASNPSSPNGRKLEMKAIESTSEVRAHTTPRRKRFPWMLFIGTVGIALLPNLIPLFHRNQNSIWPLQNVTHMLESNVFGQSEAINSLTYALNELFLTNKSGVVFFTGSVGVGKTLTSSLIQKVYPWQGDLYLEFADNLAYRDFRKPLFKNLLVIEDCNEKNRQKTMDAIRSFTSHAKATNHELIILSIFTHKTDQQLASFLDLASKTLDHYYHVPFKNLDRESVKKCIEKFIDSSKLKIDLSAVEKLTDKQMELNDENVSPGCKQIDALVIKMMSIVRRPFDDNDE